MVKVPTLKSGTLTVFAKPTADQLNAFEEAASVEETNTQVISTRVSLYGGPAKQLENIIENGLQAEIDRVAQIKADNPKI
jgi:hypothetical protein